MAGLSLLLSAQVSSSPADYTLTVIAENLDHPWAVTQLPDASFLVTERTGQLLRVAPDGSRQAVEGVPASYFAGQGGLLDVVLHPDFAENQRIYLSYAHGTPEANSTAITRATLDGNRLLDAKRILLVQPSKDTPQHYGGRMLFLPDGTLLLTVGEGFDYREAAQDLGNEMGKILRIKDDGSTPADNPFSNENSQRIWSYGHRNAQGLAYDADSETVFMHEHGPRGGDEINVVTPGKNYGWPAITYGLDYSGARVSPFTNAEGMEQPLLHWTPSIAPSSMVLYTGAHFPQWRGDLLVGALVDKEVRRVDLEAGEVVAQESLFRELDARIREVRMGLDGHLYLLTDGEGGKLLRVEPVNGR
jgi:glucose/arabinose dehydrogenase